MASITLEPVKPPCLSAHATSQVFFSDIHQFTAIANTMSSDELLQYVGYIFGVMDIIASYMNIHKVCCVQKGWDLHAPPPKRKPKPMAKCMGMLRTTGG